MRLVDLLDEAVARCKATIKTRREERNEPISDEVSGRTFLYVLCLRLLSSRTHYNATELLSQFMLT